jgi:hypothetical protein
VREKSFFEKYRTALIGVGIVAGIVLIVGFVFISASTPAYACSIQLTPASPAPSGQPITGQQEDDLGRNHVAVGTSVTYTYCPPASGQHYNAAGDGPIQPRYYSPDDSTIPQGWIHNLEHGALVILYNCTAGGCDDADQATLKALATNFPNSPKCNLAPGILSPVITRFDNMKAKFAAVVWDRVLFQDTLNTDQMLQFFKNVGETTNPEQQCNPNASASPSINGNLNSPDATNPVAQPATTASPAESSAASPAGSAPAPSGS